MMQQTHIWQSFVQTHRLSEKQQQQFLDYLDMLRAWNERINLTAITSVADIIHYHFADSLALAKAFDMSEIRVLCDIGSGGGLPGIPLAIAYPDLDVILVEVVGKKVSFLKRVAQKLGIDDRVEVVSLDWRSFLRSTDFACDVVCARASLRPDELTRMFRANSPYKNAHLVYWASQTWHIEPPEEQWFEKEVAYQVGDKKRKLVIFHDQKRAVRAEE